MELQWIGVAFALGMVARWVGQPPLLGFLAAGFVLEGLGLRPDDSLRELAELGIQLLLFGIGLKLDLRTVLRPQVWATTLLHMATSVGAFGGLFVALSLMSVPMAADVGLVEAALLGFAVSFSSTVFAVKVVEERDDLAAVYGMVAIGILVVQDLVAVVFMAASAGKVPSPWALGLLLLVPLRPWLRKGLSRIGHGELLVLAGVAATLGGVRLFEWLDLKGDLGALTAGIVLAGHAKSEEMAKAVLGLKDLFLVGFFLSVGLTGLPTVETTLVAVLLVLAMPLKGLLFFGLLTQLKLRVRSGVFAGATLTNFSEFGLIVGAYAVAEGWLASEWLVTLATALALSFLASSSLNARVYALYGRYREGLRRFELPGRIPEEAVVDVHDATALVFGMGRVGTGAYDELRERFGDGVVGFDIDSQKVAEHAGAGRRVVLGSATDIDFWERLHVDRARVRLVLLAMSSHVENRIAVEQIRAQGYTGLVAATARYADELPDLCDCGADVAYHVLAESGPGFVRHSLEALDAPPARPSIVVGAEA